MGLWQNIKLSQFVKYAKIRRKGSRLSNSAEHAEENAKTLLGMADTSSIFKAGLKTTPCVKSGQEGFIPEIVQNRISNRRESFAKFIGEKPEDVDPLDIPVNSGNRRWWWIQDHAGCSQIYTSQQKDLFVCLLNAPRPDSPSAQRSRSPSSNFNPSKFTFAKMQYEEEEVADLARCTYLNWMNTSAEDQVPEIIKSSVCDSF
ncbi:hypothetical protein BJ742DRAFT_744033 [Cladochytrium replicatum]|nr:hypothetical protein BJ742DRAFT_744033 [Cladochytrium replicatum]